MKSQNTTKTASASSSAAKEESTTANPKPKRALTSYNIFTAYERQRILAKRDFPGAPPATLADVQRVAFQNQFKKRRQHRKTAGLIGFRALSDLIATRWRNLPKSERALFEYQATVEKVKRDHAMKEWKRREKLIQKNHKKTTTNSSQQTTDEEDSISSSVVVAADVVFPKVPSSSSSSSSSTNSGSSSAVNAVKVLHKNIEQQPRASITPSPTVSAGSTVATSATSSMPQEQQQHAATTSTMVALLQSAIAKQQELQQRLVQQQVQRHSQTPSWQPQLPNVASTASVVSQEQQSHDAPLPVFQNQAVAPSSATTNHYSSLQGLMTNSASHSDSSAAGMMRKPQQEQRQQSAADDSCFSLLLLQPTPLAPHATPAQIRGNNNSTASTAHEESTAAPLPEDDNDDLFASLWLEEENGFESIMTNQHDGGDLLDTDTAFESFIGHHEDEPFMIVG